MAKAKDKTAPVVSPGTDQEPLPIDPVVADAVAAGELGDVGTDAPECPAGGAVDVVPEKTQELASKLRNSLADGDTPAKVDPKTTARPGGLEEALRASENAVERFRGTADARASEVLPQTPDGPLWSVQFQTENGHPGRRIHAPDAETAKARYFQLEQIVTTSLPIKVEQVDDDS